MSSTPSIPLNAVSSGAAGNGAASALRISRRLFAISMLALPMTVSAGAMAASPKTDNLPEDLNEMAAAGNAMTPDQIEMTLRSMAESFRSWPKAPIVHWPDEQGLEYENIFFPSEDGVPLEGWYIPRRGSDKIIIANHPRWFNRAGLPSHLEPWSALGGPGNNFEVNFVPDYKILHDAGYNVLAYDMRNFGHSSTANGGVFTVGRYESRDVVGSLNYVRNREDTRDKRIGLFSRCAGGNATLFAMTRRPEAFEGVRCLVSPQPLSSRVAAERAMERIGIPAAYIDKLNQLIQLQTSFTLDQLSPVPWAKNATIPTFLYQVRDDPNTRPSDVQSMYDNLPMAEKKLHWIGGTTRRWDGYAYFQREPKQILDWFARYMA